MIAQTKAALKQRVQRWVRSRSQPGIPQQLGASNLYILPSGFGWAYAAILLTIATGAINYQLNPAFLFVFLLMIIGLIGMWETHRNLKGLSIRCLEIDDTEQGLPAKVTLLLTGEKAIRFALYFSFDDGEPVKLEKLTQAGEETIITLPTLRRGRFKLPTIKIHSYYPLGLYRAWGYAYFDIEYYIYPQAKSPGFWPETSAGQNKHQKAADKAGDDELHELKSVASPWAQASHIAWKISARGQGWYLKTMTSPAGENWFFRIEDLKENNIELNLQQLSYWIQTAEQSGHLYGLELNGKSIELNHGEQHMSDCLRQLAIY